MRGEGDHRIRSLASCFLFSIEAQKQEVHRQSRLPNEENCLRNVIHSESVEGSGRLMRLGVSAEVFRDAVAMGIAARNSCTTNDPAIASGFFAWARTVRGLRDLLADAGWTKGNDWGLETVVSPDGKCAIAVATGDSFTGSSTGSPKTKYPRGPATVAAVEQNQPWLFKEMEPDHLEPAPTDRVTWVLLMAYVDKEVRCELSFPAAIGDDGRVESWSERIILTPVLRDKEPIVIPADQEPDIVVEVSRRTV